MMTVRTMENSNGTSSLPPLPVAVFDLSERTRLRVSGGDRVRFLNGQVSQNVQRLRAGMGLPACVTSAKGRMQAEVWISLYAGDLDAVWVDAEPGMEELLQGRLERYAIADEVEVVSGRGAGVLFHVTGSEEGTVEGLEGYDRVRVVGLGVGGWDVWIPAGESVRVWGSLPEGLRGSGALWERWRVERGIPKWGAELGEETLPPEAGLDRTHVDYHKGCYMGQEVLSRLKSVGHVNRVLARFRGRGEQLPQSGSELRQGGAVVGSVTSAVVLDGGGIAAMGYVRRGVEGSEFETASGVCLERI
jgi:folate-binding protein YgfZ